MKTDDNPDGGLDDETIQGMQAGIRADRLAFFAGFFEAFFGAGDKTDLVSEPQKRFALQIAALASPKGTLDCIDAFGRTDFPLWCCMATATPSSPSRSAGSVRRRAFRAAPCT